MVNSYDVRFFRRLSSLLFLFILLLKFDQACLFTSAYVLGMTVALTEATLLCCGTFPDPSGPCAGRSEGFFFQHDFMRCPRL